MKKGNLKKLSAALAAAVMLSAMPVYGVCAAENENSIYYEYHFDNESEKNIFSGDGSTFTVEDGVCKIVTEKPNGTARSVYAAADSTKPVHKVAQGETDTLEAKVKFEKNTIKYLFAARDSSDTANEKTNPAILKFGDTSGKITSVGSNNMFKNLKMLSNKWYQIYFVFDNDKYTLYINGINASDAPIELNGGAAVNISQIDKFLFQGNKNTTAAQTTYVDDIVAQKLVPIYLAGSSIENGAADVPTDTEKLTLDFNTIADSTSLENLTVKANGEAVDKSEYSVSVNETDATCIDVSFNGNLRSNALYTVSYNGIKDVINAEGANTASGEISFTTEQRETPFEMTDFAPQTDVKTDKSITVNFNKVVSGASLQNITVTPQIEFKAEASGTSVKITPVYNWYADKEYTVSFNGLAAADGSTSNASIVFNTVKNPYDGSGVSGDATWYSDNKVNASKASAMGVCGVSYGNGIRSITDFYNKPGDLPFCYKNGLGSGEDVVSAPVLYVKSKQHENAIIYKAEKGVESFTLKTAEKKVNSGVTGTIELYTAPVGADFTDNSVYTKAEVVKSGEVSEKWNSGITYKINANSADIGYIKAVVKLPEDTDTTNFVSVYTPSVIGADIKPYNPSVTGAYKAENKSYNTVDVCFDGFLDKASVSADKFSITDNNVLSAEIISNTYRDTVRLSLSNELSDGALYSVTASAMKDIFGNDTQAQTLSFTASNKPVSITEAKKSDSKISGTIAVPDSSKYIGGSAKLAAAYYADGVLTNVKLQDIDLKLGNNTFSADAPNENETVMIMLWNDMNCAVPVCKAKTAE